MTIEQAKKLAWQISSNVYLVSRHIDTPDGRIQFKVML